MSPFGWDLFLATRDFSWCSALTLHGKLVKFTSQLSMIPSRSGLQFTILLFHAPSQFRCWTSWNLTLTWFTHWVPCWSSSAPPSRNALSSSPRYVVQFAENLSLPSPSRMHNPGFLIICLMRWVRNLIVTWLGRTIWSCSSVVWHERQGL